MNRKNLADSVRAHAAVLLPFTLVLASGLGGCDDASKNTPPASASASASAPAPKAATPTAASASASVAAAASSAPALPPPGEPTTYDIDVSHSRVGFSVRHMMVSNVHGEFKKFSGTTFIDEKNPSASKVSLEIDADSIDTRDAKRDTHLKGPDFFDVKKFPKLTFTSTSAERSATGGWSVKGDLTIHGVTKPVTLEVDPIVPETKDPWGGVHRGTRAHTKIDRKDYGLTWSKALETGGAVVGDEISIELDIELVKPQPPAAKK